MLILGGRYGTLDPASGISYTEIEYDYARSQGKPMFAVVITDQAVKRKVQAGGPDFIETRNGNALENFRKKVLSYISSFFDDEKDIKLTVYESLADFTSRKELIGWVRGNVVVDNLPLFEEIKKLSDENSELCLKLSESERRLKIYSAGEAEFESLRDVLKSTKVTVPEGVGKDAPFDLDLFQVFIQTQDEFCTGINNRSGMSKLENFLYFTVAPKLQIHGLIGNEKVAGAQYRRCAITPKGAQFLSEYAKRLAKQDKESVEPSETKKNSLAEREDAQVSSSSSVTKPRTRVKKSLPSKD